MKKNPFLFPFIFLLFLFGLSASPARAEDLSLKIRAFLGQNSAKVGMMVLTSVQVENPSSGSSVDFWANKCSYEKQWVTDDPQVLIQSWTCEENSFEEITLGPGDIYEKSIMLYIPEKDKTGEVSFRLGFELMGENGDVMEPLWSDPVTLNVIVPEEMRDDAPARGVTD